jgi:cytidine deaminase
LRMSTRSRPPYALRTRRSRARFADVCGEVAAICHAVTHGYRDYEAIVALKATGEGEYRILAPCGRCREVISDSRERE